MPKPFFRYIVCLELRSTHLDVCQPFYKWCSTYKDVGAANVDPDAKPYRMTSRDLLLRPCRWEINCSQH